MSLEIGEIKNREDAEKISEIILRSLNDDETTFNPYQDRMFQCNDGSIRFMGDELSPEKALQHIADHVWENRKKVNKEIKRWKKFGSQYIN